MPKRTDELRMVDPILSTIAQGYSNSALISETLFPIVNVNKSKLKIPVFGKEAFYLRDVDRAIRADSNRIAANELSLIDFETQEKDLEMALDHLEQEEAGNLEQYMSQITKTLADGIALNREKYAADIAQNVSNYSATMKTVITSTDAFDDYTNTTDPIEVIKDGMEAIRSKIGKFPNTMVLGEATFRAIMGHPKILDKIKYSSLGKATKEILKELTDIGQIAVGLSVYTDDGTSFSDIWQDNIVLAYVDANERGLRSEFNPSYGYTFRRKGMPEVDTYFENGGKIKVLRYTDNYSVNVTAQDAAYLISDTNHN
jgi:hypothetical protein